MTSYARFLRLGIIPIAIVYAILFIFPAFNFLQLSFTEPGAEGLTLDVFARVLAMPVVLDSLRTTLYLSLITGIFSLIIGYLGAYFVVHGGRLLSTFVFVAALSSLLTSAVARALGWRVLLADSGPINALLVGLGLVDEPLRLINNAIAVTIGLIHVQAPIVMIALISVIEGLPKNYERAAHGLGAPAWRAFFQIHLALTWKDALPISLIAVMATAAYFTTPMLLGGGRVLVTSILVQQFAQVVVDYRTAAAISVILTLLVAAIALLVLVATRLRSRSERRLRKVS
ncbi:MAG TPA: hypothetical protein VIR54_23975 [Vicinamibacterales bacterium]